MQLTSECMDMERQNARHFASTLVSVIPSLLALRTSIQIDEALQEFASKYCQGNIYFNTFYFIGQLMVTCFYYNLPILTPSSLIFGIIILFSLQQILFSHLIYKFCLSLKLGQILSNFITEPKEYGRNNVDISIK